MTRHEPPLLPVSSPPARRGKPQRSPARDPRRGLTATLFAAFLLVMMALAPSPSRAQPAGSDLLASNSFDDVRRGIEALTASADPRAEPILTALQENRLYARPDKALFIKTSDGWLDALTGQPAPDAGSLKPVRVNNTIRRTLDASLGSLRLSSPDAITRQSAADALFKARDPAGLAALDHAIAQEKSSGVRRTMEQARAAIQLYLPDTPEADRVAAVATLRDRGDIDARALLAGLSNQSPAVSLAAESAIATIDHNLMLWGLAQNLYYGLSLGSVLLLSAAGIVIYGLLALTSHMVLRRWHESAFGKE